MESEESANGLDKWDEVGTMELKAFEKVESGVLISHYDHLNSIVKTARTHERGEIPFRKEEWKNEIQFY